MRRDEEKEGKSPHLNTFPPPLLPLPALLHPSFLSPTSIFLRPPPPSVLLSSYCSLYLPSSTSLLPSSFLLTPSSLPAGVAGASAASQRGPAASGQRAYLASVQREELLLAAAEDNHPDGGRRGGWGSLTRSRAACVCVCWGLVAGGIGCCGEPIRKAIDQSPLSSQSWKAESVRLTADWAASQKHLDPP